MTKLWQRNVIGIVVTLATAAIVCAVDLYPQWVSYRDTIVPEHVIAARTTSSVYGQTWRLGSIRRIAKFSNQILGAVPPGATLTVVTIDRSGSPAMRECGGVITDGRRRWQAQGFSGFNVPLGDGATDRCSRPGVLQFSFLLPRGVAPSAVDITDANQAILLRIMV